MSLLRIAGELPVAVVLDRLRRDRPVFHSEADFQHAFAWTVRTLEPTLRVRLEAHPRAGVNLDVLITTATGREPTAVELKYLTTRLDIEVEGEQFSLRHHSAQDTRGYDVVRDLTRLESLAQAGYGGLALVLTNDASYWRPPAGRRPTNHDAFRVHEGVVLHGDRDWTATTGPGTKRGREQILRVSGHYECRWVEYSRFDGRNGAFKLLSFEVPPVGTA